VRSVHQGDVLADNSNEVSKESNDNESFSKEGEDVLFLSILSIVGIIVGIASTDVDGLSLVDGEVEDDLPDGPKEDCDNGHDGSSPQFTSGSSLVSGEEVN